MSINQRSVKNLNGKVLRERDSRFWRQCLYSVFIGIAIVTGFAFAVQQHFAAHQFSLKNVELQRERDRLKIEQKRLLLEREIAVSLDRLKQRAEKIGLRDPTVNQINSLAAASDGAETNEQQTFISSRVAAKRDTSIEQTKKSR